MDIDREAADLMTRLGLDGWDIVDTVGHIAEKEIAATLRRAVEREREACAVVADELAVHGYTQAGREIAAGIRARSGA